jgi:hypothetical protein
MLLAAREQCVRDLSVLCLDAVDQVGSAALNADTQLIDAISNGTEQAMDATFAAPDIALVERLGDSAIVSLGLVNGADAPKTQPASLLLMKGEAGWRIRGYVFPLQ